MPDLQGLLNSVFDSTENALRVTSVGEAVFYSAGELTPMQNAGAVTNVVTNSVPRLAFPDAATSSVGLVYAPPKWWSHFGVSVVWVPEVGTGGNVRFTCTVKKLDVAIDLLSEAVFATATQDVAAGTTALQVKYTVDILPNVSAAISNFGSVYIVEVAREGGHANDTLAGAIGIMDVALRRNVG